MLSVSVWAGWTAGRGNGTVREEEMNCELPPPKKTINKGRFRSGTGYDLLIIVSCKNKILVIALFPRFSDLAYWTPKIRIFYAYRLSLKRDKNGTILLTIIVVYLNDCRYTQYLCCGTKIGILNGLRIPRVPKINRANAWTLCLLQLAFLLMWLFAPAVIDYCQKVKFIACSLSFCWYMLTLFECLFFAF